MGFAATHPTSCIRGTVPTVLPNTPHRFINPQALNCGPSQQPKVMQALKSSPHSLDASQRPPPLRPVPCLSALLHARTHLAACSLQVSALAGVGPRNWQKTIAVTHQGGPGRIERIDGMSISRLKLWCPGADLNWTANILPTQVLSGWNKIAYPGRYP